MSTYKHRFWRYESRTRLFFSVMYSLKRRRELRRLTAWADRKHLSGPLRSYRTRIADEERRLLRYAIKHPHTTKLARWAHGLAGLLFPPPRVHRAGSAANYRYAADANRSGEQRQLHERCARTTCRFPSEGLTQLKKNYRITMKTL